MKRNADNMFDLTPEEYFDPSDVEVLDINGYPVEVFNEAQFDEDSYGENWVAWTNESGVIANGFTKEECIHNAQKVLIVVTKQANFYNLETFKESWLPDIINNPYNFDINNDNMFFDAYNQMDLEESTVVSWVKDVYEAADVYMSTDEVTNLFKNWSRNRGIA